MAHESPDRVELFLALIAQHQRRLHQFVLSLVPNPADADDILQETHLVLWREFRLFTEGTKFSAWANSIAFNQVLAWRKKRQRDRIILSDEFLQLVAKELDDAEDRHEEQARALAGCLDQLPTHHRELMTLRYTEGHTIEAIARRLNRTTEAVYRMLSRIRHVLFDCTSKALAHRGTA